MNNDLSEFYEGQRVRYIPFLGCPETLHELGNVSSVGAQFVFVKFDKHTEKHGWDGATAMGCSPQHLEVVK